MKTKKHKSKRNSNKSLPRFQLKTILGKRSMGGYSALKYVSLLLACAAVITVATGAIYLQSRGSTLRQPLAAFSNSPEAPSTNELARHVNEARKSRKLPELVIDESLTAIAEDRLRNMVAFQYYSHQNLAGKYYYEQFQEHGLSVGYSCENLAIEFSLDATTYFNEWMQSSLGHKECMLNKNVTKAGYASGVYSKAASSGLKDTVYLVVAIYAGPPFEKTD